MSDSKFRTVVQLCEIPRKRGEEKLRLSIDEMQADDGRVPQWVSAKGWFRTSDDKWLPGKAGITFRRGELRQVIEALERAERILNGEETVREPQREAAKPELRAEDNGYPF